MTLEAGLTPLDMTGGIAVELGGLDLVAVGVTEIQGLEDLAELEGDGEDMAGDGEHPGELSMVSRELSILMDPCPGVSLPDGDISVWLTETIATLKRVLVPMPDRTATRRLRFWLPGYDQARRLDVRPASKPFTLVTNQRRVQYGQAALTVRLDAPCPIVASDEYHELTFTAGQTRVVTNEGDLCGVNPTGWWLEAPGPVTLTHLDTGESLRLPAGPVSVSQYREVVGPGTYGVVGSGDPANWVPRWPLLRPGPNTIQASAPCTMRRRHLWG